MDAGMMMNDGMMILARRPQLRSAAPPLKRHPREARVNRNGCNTPAVLGGDVAASVRGFVPCVVRPASGFALRPIGTPHTSPTLFL